MDMSANSSGAVSQMRMAFFTSVTTPLYSDSWAPTNTSTYAGTCVFLVLLATLFRGLLALKGWKETAWLDAEFNRRYVVVAGRPRKTERISQDSDTKRLILTENGVEEEVMVVKKRGLGARPWRLSVDPLRAVIDTIVAGVAYLLMLAVMTMNVGYFMSVLAGTFLGSLAVGRYTVAFHHDH